MMSQSRNRFFSTPNCLNSIKNSNIPGITASTTLVTSILLLDFICSEKLQHENINWDYYTETPSRIVWLCLSALMQGLNLIYVIRALKQESENNSINRSSALNALAATTLYSTTMAFANFSLTNPLPPISLDDWGYVTARACLNGGLVGSVMSSGVYFLKKLDFTIRPITLEHIKLISAGIVLVMMQEMLNFVSDQMIKQKYIDWDAAISAPRTLGWDAIVIATTGILYGITKYSYQKYSQPEDGSMNTINKILLPLTATFSFLYSFTMFALTTPINAENAPYITTRSLSSITDGLVTGANLSIFISLFRPRPNQPVAAQTPLLSESEPEPSDSVLVLTPQNR